MSHDREKVAYLFADKTIYIFMMVSIFGIFIVIFTGDHAAIFRHSFPGICRAWDEAGKQNFSGGECDE